MLTAEQMKSNLETFYGIIKEYISEPRATKLTLLYESLEEELVIAPASSRTSYHNAFPGGYVDHVIRVVKASLSLYDTWQSFGADMSTFTKEELVFAAINHDLGKLGHSGKPAYIPNDSEWHVKNQGAVYKPNVETPFMLIQDTSLYILQQAGIECTFNEYLSIKIHDGLYDDGNKAYLVSSQNDSKLRSCMPLLLHQADILAARVEWEREWLLTGVIGQSKPVKKESPTTITYRQKAINDKLTKISSTNPGLLKALKQI